MGRLVFPLLLLLASIKVVQSEVGAVATQRWSCGPAGIDGTCVALFTTGLAYMGRRPCRWWWCVLFSLAAAVFVCHVLHFDGAGVSDFVCVCAAHMASARRDREHLCKTC